MFLKCFVYTIFEVFLNTYMGVSKVNSPENLNILK